MGRPSAPHSCDGCVGWLAALASPFTDGTGQRHLLVETRIAVDSAALRALWLSEDRAAFAAARAARAEGLVPDLLPGFDPPTRCWTCLCGWPCVSCDRFGHDPVLDA